MRLGLESVTIFAIAGMLALFAACASSPSEDDDRLDMDECDNASVCTGRVKNSSKEVVIVKDEKNEKHFYQVKRVDDSDLQGNIRKKDVTLVKLDPKSLERDRSVPTVRARIYEWEKVDTPDVPTGKSNNGFRSRRKIQNIEIEEN